MDLSEQKQLEEPAVLDGPSKLLLAAANWIEQNGLYQGWDSSGFDDLTGRGCVIHAINHHCIRWRDSDIAQERLRSVIPDGNIVAWVNATDQEKVVAKLRAVALSK